MRTFQEAYFQLNLTARMRMDGSYGQEDHTWGRRMPLGGHEGNNRIIVPPFHSIFQFSFFQVLHKGVTEQHQAIQAASFGSIHIGFNASRLGIVHTA